MGDRCAAPTARYGTTLRKTGPAAGAVVLVEAGDVGIFRDPEDFDIALFLPLDLLK